MDALLDIAERPDLARLRETLESRILGTLQHDPQWLLRQRGFPHVGDLYASCLIDREEQVVRWVWSTTRPSDVYRLPASPVLLYPDVTEAPIGPSFTTRTFHCLDGYVRMSLGGLELPTLSILHQDTTLIGLVFEEG